MDKRLKVNFVPFSNFGDTSVPYMLRKNNIPFVFAHHNIKTKVIMTGSILGIASRPETVVWGSGIIKNNCEIVTDARYLAVRGPRTLNKLKLAGVDTTDIAIGDPMLLFSKFFTPTSTKKYKLGIVPHTVDYTAVMEVIRTNPDNYRNTVVLHPCRSISQIEGFINSINECEAIVSSSLHGIICAHTYNIPGSWLKLGNRLMGDDVKFHDYLESVKLYSNTPLTDIPAENDFVAPHKPQINTDQLWECRPWENLSDDYYVDIDTHNWTEQCYPRGYNNRIVDDTWWKK
jgi:hypothetical protein